MSNNFGCRIRAYLWLINRPDWSNLFFFCIFFHRVHFITDFVSDIDECLKHSYYTRVHFMFLVDFTFKKAHYSPRSNFWNFCELQVKRVVSGNLELNKRSRRNIGSNFATSQRRDALSIAKSQQVIQRREASTSRHLNVATSPRFLP